MRKPFLTASSFSPSSSELSSSVSTSEVSTSPSPLSDPLSDEEAGINLNQVLKTVFNETSLLLGSSINGGASLVVILKHHHLVTESRFCQMGFFLATYSCSTFLNPPSTSFLVHVLIHPSVERLEVLLVRRAVALALGDILCAPLLTRLFGFGRHV